MRYLGIRTKGGTNVSDAVFFPLTPEFESYAVHEARFIFWLNALDVEVAPGVQYSNDGVTWDAADAGIDAAYNTNTPTSSWVTASDRTVLGTWRTCPGDFEAPIDSGTPVALSADRLFVRFGGGCGTRRGSSAVGAVPRRCRCSSGRR